MTLCYWRTCEKFLQVVQALNHAHRRLVHLADQTQRVAVRHDVLGVEDDHGGGRVGEGSGRTFVDATRRRGRRMPIDGTGRARERRLDVRLLHRRRKRHDVRFPESAEVWTEPLTAKPKPAAIPPYPHTRVGDTARVACRPPRAPWCADSRDGLKGSAGPAKSRPSRFAGGDCACDLSLMTGEKRTLGASRIRKKETETSHTLDAFQNSTTLSLHLSPHHSLPSAAFSNTKRRAKVCAIAEDSRITSPSWPVVLSVPPGCDCDVRAFSPLLRSRAPSPHRRTRHGRLPQSPQRTARASPRCSCRASARHVR